MANKLPNVSSLRAGGERVHRLGANGSASRQHEGRVRAGAERRAVRGAARADRRPLHPEAHEETEQPPHLARPRQREGTDAQDVLLRVRLSDEGRRLPAGTTQARGVNRGSRGVCPLECLAVEREG